MLILIVIAVVVVIVALVVVYSTPTINYNHVPSDRPNKYTDRIKSRLPTLDRAQIEVYNYGNYAVGAGLLANYTPKTTGEQAVANNIIDYINMNGVNIINDARVGF